MNARRAFCYVSTLVLVVFLLSFCQRDSLKIAVQLDQPLKNSFFQYWSPWSEDTSQLNDFETVLYHNGVWRVDARSVDVEYGSTRFRLGMIDADQDGRFTTPGLDLLVLSVYGVDTAALDPYLPSIGLVQTKNFIQVDRSYFLLTDLDSTGQSISLIPWDRQPGEELTAQLRTSLGKIPVRTCTGEEVYLSTAAPSNKDRLILVWSYGPDRGELIREIAYYRKRWEDRVEVVSINMLDDHDRIQAFLSEHNIDLPCYLATSRTCQSLNCHALLPFAVVVDTYGRVLRSGMKTQAIMEYLELPMEEASSGLY